MRPLVRLAAFSVLVGCAQIAGLEEPIPGDVGADGGGPAAADGTAASATLLEVTPAELDLGDVTCGSSVTGPSPIVVRNKGTEPIRYSVQLPEGTTFELKGPLTGELAPSAVATLNVVAKADEPRDTSTEVIVTANEALAQVKIKARGRGPALEFAPGIVDFGDVRYQQGGTPIPLTLRNTGTDPITVGSFEGQANGFDVTWPGKPAPLVIPADGEAALSATLGSSAQPSATPLSAKLLPVVTGALCGARPTLEAKGRPINTEVTLTVADWGSQSCGAAAPGTRTVVITNYTPTALSYIATTTGPAFSITSGASGPLPANGTATITLTAGTVSATPGLLEQNVDVNIAGLAPPSGGPRTTKGRIDVRGALLAITPTEIRNYRYVYRSTDWKAFDVVNQGNEQIDVDYRLERTVNFAGTAWTWYSSDRLMPAVTRQIRVGFRPDYSGSYEAKVTVVRKAGGTLCKPPAVLTVAGQR